MDAARTLAQAIEGIRTSGGPFDRGTLDGVLKTVLERNPRFLGTWTCWEPQALDGRDAEFANAPGHDGTGRYIPYWCRDAQGKTTCEALVDYDKSGAGDYYLLARNGGVETILDPYRYNVAGREVLITSTAAPIRVGNAVVGVAGVDIALDDLHDLVKGIALFSTGYLSIVANNGLYVAHPDPERIGQDIARTDPWIGPFLADLRLGKGFTTESYSKTVGANVKRIGVPIQIGGSRTPWAVLASIPTGQIVAEARRTTVATTAIGAIALAALVLIVALIARGIGQPIARLAAHLASGADQVAAASEQLSSASQDLSQSSSEQASSLEETSAALEEVSTGVRRTAGNADQAEGAMRMVGTGVDQGLAAVRRLSEAIDRKSVV